MQGTCSETKAKEIGKERECWRQSLLLLILEDLKDCYHTTGNSKDK